MECSTFAPQFPLAITMKEQLLSNHLLRRARKQSRTHTHTHTHTHTRYLLYPFPWKNCWLVCVRSYRGRRVRSHTQQTTTSGWLTETSYASVSRQTRDQAESMAWRDAEFTGLVSSLSRIWRLIKYINITDLYMSQKDDILFRFKAGLQYDVSLTYRQRNILR